jgi:hypothetical protein
MGPVEHYKTVEEITTYHILYSGHSESRRLEQGLRKLKGKPMPIVSDIRNSAQEGVGILCVTEQNRIKLQMNLDAGKSSALVVRSRLLCLAELVKSTS